MQGHDGVASYSLALWSQSRFYEHTPSTRLGTLRSSIDPRLDQLAEQRLAAGSGLATVALLPSPSHQVIVSEMFVQQRQIAPAVAIAIFELCRRNDAVVRLARSAAPHVRRRPIRARLGWRGSP
jgi:hypothetical protein